MSLIVVLPSVASFQSEQTRLLAVPIRGELELTHSIVLISSELSQLQKELLLAKEEIERQATLILSLEASLGQRAVVPLDAPEFEKDAKILEL